MINSVHLLTTAGPLTADDRGSSWPGAEVAAAFADAVESGRLNLPLPGGGRTRQRWAVLAQLAGEDLSLARLAEGHTDALAILAELGAPTAPPAGSRWGVWAAQPPGPGLTASKTGSGRPRRPRGRGPRGAAGGPPGGAGSAELPDLDVALGETRRPAGSLAAGLPGSAAARGRGQEAIGHRFVRQPAHRP